jgi:hypothetical protein
MLILFQMTLRFAIAILLLFAADGIAVTRSAAAELSVSQGRVEGGGRKVLVIRRYARVWPQDCFLMPDVIVAIDALGPYCSSPRGYYRGYRRY